MTKLNRLMYRVLATGIVIVAMVNDKIPFYICGTTKTVVIKSYRMFLNHQL